MWEIAIKQSLSKLELKDHFSNIEDFIEENDITLLPIEFNHLRKLLKLPFHHRDPFDRIIIAQAIAEQIKIITKDDAFVKYKAKHLWK